MKKILALFLLLLVGCAMLVACGDEEEPITYYSVEFDSDGAEKYTARELADGSLVTVYYQPFEKDNRTSIFFTKWRA
jgi:ABC-type uncharacterized transport system auxiliary subunit